jgi:signal transduction histidine kinase
MELARTLDELEQRVARRTAELSATNTMLKSNIEERRRTNTELRETNKKLLDLEQLKEDLINMVVHDMKNPITSSMMALDVIEMELGSQMTDQQIEYIKIGKRSQFKLSQMISNLLELSKLEENRMQVIEIDVNLVELIDRTVEQYGGIMGEDIPDVKVSVDPAARLLSSDPYLLERIVSNILSNAIKHSHSDEDISIRAERIGESRDVLISIEDRGEGIPKKYQKKIFEKFFQTSLKKSGSRTDTGLGLSFCKLAVEAMGGHIRVRSGSGEGSCFSVFLPNALKT